MLDRQERKWLPTGGNIKESIGLAAAEKGEEQRATMMCDFLPRPSATSKHGGHGRVGSRRICSLRNPEEANCGVRLSAQVRVVPVKTGEGM